MAAFGIIAFACVIAGTYSLALIGAGFAAADLIARPGLTGSPRKGLLIDVSTAFCLGLGLYAGLWILLGLAGELRFGIVLGIVVLGCSYAVWTFTKFWRGRRAAGAGSKAWLPPTLSEFVVEAAVFVLVLLLVFASLRPPFGDSVALYLAWPKVIAASGTIAALPQYDEACSLWMIAEANFAALMILGGESAAKLFVGLNLLAAIGATWLLARECACGRRGQLLAIAAVATSTAVIEVTVDGKVDLVAVAPGLAAVLWALRLGRDSERPHIPLLIGMLASTAAGVKVTYIVPLGAALLMLVGAAALATSGTAWDRAQRATRWFLLIGLSALVIAVPELVKNWLLFSKPLLPFIGTTMGREVWFPWEVVARILLTLPFALTFGDYWAQLGNLSPLVIGLLPLFLFRPRNGQAAASGLLIRVSLAAVVGMAVWFVAWPSHLAPRYFLAPLLLFVLPAAWAGEQAWSAPYRLLAAAVVLFAVLISGLTTMEVARTHADASWIYLAARAKSGPDTCPPPSFASDFGHCNISKIVNERMQRGDRLLFLSYSRYYLRSDILQCVIPYWLDTGLGVIDADFLRTTATDYILLDRGVFGRPLSIAADLVDVLYHDDFFTFYKVKDAIRHSPGAPACSEVRPGYWRVSSSGVSHRQ